MENAIIVILMLAVVLMFALMIYSVKKEKSLSGFYKQINVCGRWYAFFTGDFLLCGAGCLIALPVLIVLMLMGKLDSLAEQMGGNVTLIAIFALGAVIFLPIGILLYRHALKKCPDNLKTRFLKDIIIMMLGTSCRLSFFFLMFLTAAWWALNKPTEYIVNGRTVYALPGSNQLYDASGNCVGVANSDKTKAVMTDSSY